MGWHIPAKRLTPSELFATPPQSYGPAPFWWWVGQPLDRSRLAWQLDQLLAKGVHNAIISYNHEPDGTSDHGTPPVFSPQWWELLCWMVDQCKRRGMQISFSDYTLIAPLLQEIGRETVEMRGGELRQCGGEFKGGESCRLASESGGLMLTAWAYPLDRGAANREGAMDLFGFVHNGCLQWTAPAGQWLVSLIWLAPTAFDPMHPQSGRKVIERLYAPFEEHCLGELGKTIPIFFQDELDFGCRMPMWSDRLPEEFRRRKGYELLPLLAGLWHDLGPIAPKLRIDYADVVTQLLEECYFIPVFNWHETRGVLLGNDNCGRGGIESGRAHYGDYFRTMRWYQAPGTDDPSLSQPRAFKGLKVNSSIAHLYGRKRVWNECFHSSGWGATPAQVVEALNQDFAYGATVVNLHGLYYSTLGSWWEWAAPDFHFRQPYWKHSAALSGYVTRLCWLLCQGTHVCDVAMVYPITSIEAGLGRLIAEPGGSISLSEQQAGHPESLLDESEAHAFGLGRHLFNAGLDFDFIDFQSLEKASAGNGQLHVAGESYRILILPAMSAARFSTLQKAREFQREGGVVIAFGVLPRASDRAGSDDPELSRLVREIFGPEAGGAKPTTHHGGPRGCPGGAGCYIPEDYRGVEDAINRTVHRDVVLDGEGLHVLHRRDESRDVYYVFNPNPHTIRGTVTFRATGSIQRWDAWTGNITAWSDVHCEGPVSRVPMHIEAGQSQVVVFEREAAAGAGEAQVGRETMGVERSSRSTLHAPRPTRVIPLDGPWDFQLRPTLDNRFGDFRLPAHEGMLGAEARRFRFAEEPADAVMPPAWQRPELDDSQWRLVTYSFGPRFWRLGPIEPGADRSALETRLAGLRCINPAVPVVVDGRRYCWQPYDISLRWGIENDPFLLDWMSGPHGLKGQVPDEYIDLNCDRAGAAWYLWTCVQSAEARTSPLVMGSRSAYAAWLNGRAVMAQTDALPAGRQSIWNLPHYRSEPRRNCVALRAGDNSLLMRFTQPPDQRVRAYVAFDSPTTVRAPTGYPLAGRVGRHETGSDRLGLRWFAGGDHPTFNCRPGRPMRAGWYRFTAPPGLKAMKIVARGPVRAWAAGAELPAAVSTQRADGTLIYHLDVPQPSPDPVVVAVRTEPTPASFGGDALPEPILLDCGAGRIPLGDWSAFGLATYSGAACYSRIVELDSAQAAGRPVLDLGGVAATAAVRVNGQYLASLIAPPWQVDLAGHVQPGPNCIEIEVANTLANHYSVGIPTPYVFPGQTVSGLLGPVRLILKPGND